MDGARPLRAVRDRIAVRNLALFARHGVHAEEAALGQRFFLDVEVRLDLAAAGRDDRIGASVDYGALVATVTAAFSARVRLIEAAAEAVAAAVLARHPAVESVAVTVRKPGAPVEAIFDHVEVSILRERNDG